MDAENILSAQLCSIFWVLQLCFEDRSLMYFIPFLYFFFFVVDKGVSLCSYVFLNLGRQGFFLSSDSFYLSGDHFKALDLKNDPFYLVRN